jgi:alkanesulfonate monooxygenase SsuD/methylene tetrahydromethanopterin reductase-like flavin-dependent oxidoreductase (luciferase family)
MRALEGGDQLQTVIQPLVVVASTREMALSRIPVWEVGHSSEGSKFWVKPSSGDFERIEDLEGLVVWGTPDDVIEQIGAFMARGVDDFVFDLRLQFDEYEAALELIGQEVLPAIRAD